MKIIKEKSLKEMPYIKVGNSVFDLELENYKTAEEAINFIYSLYSGKEGKDKYGNKIKITTEAEKKMLIDDLKNASMVKLYMNSRFSEVEKKLLAMLLGIDKL